MTALAKHKDPAISKPANVILIKWKRTIKNESQNSKPDAKETPNDAESRASRETKDTRPPAPAQTKPAKEAKEPQEAKETKESGEAKQPKDEGKKRVREADVEYEEQQKLEEETDEKYEEFMRKNETKDMIRKNIRKSILKNLLKYEPNRKKECAILAVKIENGIVKAYGGNPSEYSNKARTIVANIMRSNDFKARILNGEIVPEEIATMDPKDMVDEHLKKKRDDMEKSIVDAKRSDFMIANMKVKEGMYT
mmetsp:Transcript_22316/g.25630  ORF Transcript_22316/g.25630 Transcript_22316/m.25630 type:complete len:252 (+) Transcript_22316:199-954(+)